MPVLGLPLIELNQSPAAHALAGLVLDDEETLYGVCGGCGRLLRIKSSPGWRGRGECPGCGREKHVEFGTPEWVSMPMGAP
ncbi:hypothetical protein [Methylomagnum sp.]